MPVSVLIALGVGVLFIGEARAERFGNVHGHICLPPRSLSHTRYDFKMEMCNLMKFNWTHLEGRADVQFSLLRG